MQAAPDMQRAPVAGRGLQRGRRAWQDSFHEVTDPAAPAAPHAGATAREMGLDDGAAPLRRASWTDDAMMRSLPDDALLAEYAAGSLPAGLSLLVASQLTFDPDGRRRVAELERLGGALLAADPAGITGAEAAAPSLDAMLARLDREGPRAEGPRPALPASEPGNPFPAPLRAALGAGPGATPEGVAWKRLLPGLAEHIIEGVGDAHEEVSLLRARPGAPIFSHTHTGVETTLVLCGLMEDRGRTLGRGDVAIATDHDDHRPRIVGDETCICLVVMTGEMRFTGRLSRVLNYLS